jgi:hypothetical protein
MKVNPWIFGLLVVAILMGTIGTAKAMGVWSVSGKVSASTGEKVVPTGTNVEELKGWMTLQDVSTAYKVPVADILAGFKLPADTPASKAIKDLESDTFSTTGLRTWLKARLGQ